MFWATMGSNNGGIDGDGNSGRAHSGRRVLTAHAGRGGKMIAGLIIGGFFLICIAIFLFEVHRAPLRDDWD